MSKICAKCTKAVYPLEELKCLDKIWHKTCFKCTECGMTLNMKTYKGFDKKPYCSAPYPHTKATAVADTPEMARIAHNTKIQSQVKYHEEFEKTIKGSKIEVTDDPESRRVKRIGSIVSQVEYKGTKPEMRRQSLPHASAETQKVIEESTVKSSPFRDRVLASNSTVYSGGGAKVDKLVETRRIGSIADYDPLNENYGSLTQGYHPSSRGLLSSQSQEWEETVVLPTTPDITNHQLSASDVPDSAAVVVSVEAQNIVEDNVFEERMEASIQPAEVVISDNTDVSNTDVFHKDSGEVKESVESDVTSETAGALDNIKSDDVSANTETLGITGDEAVEDIDTSGHGSDEASQSTGALGPEAEEEGAESDIGRESTEKADEESSGVLSDATETHEQQEHASNDNDVTPVKTVDDVSAEDTADKPQGPIFQAVYEYEAQDDDEVSFNEGDHIVDVQMIDEGWMVGKVVRTGKSGMLPSNYIEPLVTAE